MENELDRRTFVAGTIGAAAVQSLLGSNASAAEATKTATETSWKPSLRYAINADTHFRQHPLEERLRRIAAAGFTAIELNSLPNFERGNSSEPNYAAIEKYGEWLRSLGLSQGVWVTNGCAGPCDSNITDPAKLEVFLTKVRHSAKISPLVGGTVSTVTSGVELPGVSQAAMTDNVVEALKRAAEIVEETGPTLVLEPLNVLVDHPGYHVVRSDHAYEIMKRVNHPRVKILFDIYHQQISEGNLINNIRKYYDQIGYFQFGDNPGRHEPYTGEIYYPNVFKAIADLGFTGMIGGEYSPAGGRSDEASVASMAAVRRADEAMRS
jgi:hydroxypyruvate isomerase